MGAELRRTSAGLIFLLTPALFGQLSDRSYVPSTEQDQADEVFGERVHSVFDEVERRFAPHRPARQESSSGPAAILSLERLRHPSAIVELRDAVQMLPGIAAHHTNLGYTVCLTGQRKWAERELREAVRLDSASVQARYLLCLLQLDQRSQEAERSLAFALQGVQNARLVLSYAHARTADALSSGRDIRELLGPQRGESTAQWVARAATLDQPSVLFGFPAFAARELD